MATVVTLSRRILFLQKLKFDIYVCLLTIVLKMLPMTFKIQLFIYWYSMELSELVWGMIYQY